MDTPALLISLFALLLAMAALWMAQRMRLKRRQVLQLRIQHAAMRDRQLAALQSLRETEPQRQAEPLAGQQEHVPREDPDQTSQAEA